MYRSAQEFYERRAAILDIGFEAQRFGENLRASNALSSQAIGKISVKVIRAS